MLRGGTSEGGGIDDYVEGGEQGGERENAEDLVRKIALVLQCFVLVLPFVYPTQFCMYVYAAVGSEGCYASDITC